MRPASMLESRRASSSRRPERGGARLRGHRRGHPRHQPAHIDYYLIKPWDPPEERLYPVINDLLADWQASFRPPFGGA